MTDLHALEAMAGKTPDAVAAEDHDRLARHYWELAVAETDYRKRLKLLKRSSAFVGRAFKQGYRDPDGLRLYMDILGQTARVHSFPQDVRRILSNVTAGWMEATGADQPQLIARRTGKVATDAASFGLGDIGVTPEATPEPWNEKEMVERMKAGQRLIFTTGYDGLLKAEIRIVDCMEPVLEMAEYRRLDSSTPTIVLEIPTGQVVLADDSVMARQWAEPPWPHWLTIDVPPGRYRACIFGFSTRRSDSVVAVLCRTDDRPPNDVGSVDSLFM